MVGGKSYSQFPRHVMIEHLGITRGNRGLSRQVERALTRQGRCCHPDHYPTMARAFKEKKEVKCPQVDCLPSMFRKASQDPIPMLRRIYYLKKKKKRKRRKKCWLLLFWELLAKTEPMDRGLHNPWGRVNCARQLSVFALSVAS